MKKAKELYMWCDIETTGLDPERSAVLEMSVIFTSSPVEGLEPYGERHFIFPLPASAVWGKSALEMHTESGLVGNVLQYTDKCGRHYVDALSEAGDDLLSWIKPRNFGRVILAGRNPVFERSFIRSNLGELYDILHYRMFDVRTLIALIPDISDKVVDAQYTHRSADDIQHDYELACIFLEQVGRVKELEAGAQDSSGGFDTSCAGCGCDMTVSSVICCDCRSSHGSGEDRASRGVGCCANCGATYTKENRFHNVWSMEDQPNCNHCKRYCLNK